MRIHIRLKAIICTAALTASAILTPLYAFAAVNSASGDLSSTLAPKNVMVSVKDADVRDVLSAIAMNMGYNIVYTGPAATISIDLDNLSPSAAFDYILKILDLTYLQEGSTYIVGDRATLQDNFRSSIALTRFNLQYITPTVMSDMISRLRLSVTVITLNTNGSSLWVQGFPSDIAKVRELVNVMDILDNREAPTPVEGEGAKALTPVKLSYLTAYEFRLLLQALGIDYSVSLLDDSDRIYLYATPDELETVLGIKDVVDQKDTFFDEGNSAGGVEVLTARNKVTKDTAITAINAMCPGLKIVSADNSSTTFVVMGEQTEMSTARELLRKLDANAEDLNTTYFTYRLTNITAAEAERRLQNITFGDKVMWYVTTHADFSGTIFIYCNEDYQEQILDLIESLDAEDGTLATGAGISAMPIYAIRNDDQTTRDKYAKGMHLYLETMLAGIIKPATWSGHDITTYGSIKEIKYDNMTVLYLEKSFDNFNAETFALIEAMIARLSDVAVDEQTSEGLTPEDYIKANPSKGPIPSKTDSGYNIWVNEYIKWVMGKIGASEFTSGANAGTLSAGIDVPIYTPPVSQSTSTPLPVETPVSADEESFNDAKDALDWLFRDGGIASEISSETTEDTVLQAAVRVTDGIENVSLRFNTSSPSSLVKPTETEKGSLTVSIILEVGEYWQVYDVALELPAVKDSE